MTYKCTYDNLAFAHPGLGYNLLTKFANFFCVFAAFFYAES